VVELRDNTVNTTGIQKFKFLQLLKNILVSMT
jgi:hypothetical protein